jgi:hypothetical protein
MGLDRGPLSLVGTTEELPGRKVAARVETAEKARYGNAQLGRKQLYFDSAPANISTPFFRHKWMSHGVLTFCRLLAWAWQRSSKWSNDVDLTVSMSRVGRNAVRISARQLKKLIRVYQISVVTPLVDIPGNICSSVRQEEIFLWLKPHFICNLYIYIQQIGVRIGCYGLGNGTHYYYYYYYY